MNVKSFLMPLYNNIPLQIVLLFTNYSSIYNFYKKAQWWPKEKIEQWQLDRLKMVVKYAYDNTSGYKQLYNESHINPYDIQKLEDIRILPYTDKKLLKDNIKDFTVNKSVVGHLRRVSTGGSTGNPFVFYSAAKYDSVEHAFMYNAWESIGWKMNDRGIILRGGFVGDENHLMKRTAYHRYSISSNYLTDIYYKSYINLIQKSKATFIHCYPSSLIELTKMILSHNDEGKLNINQIFISSESLYEWQLKLINKAFPQAHIMHWYGHCERAVWAPWCECNEKFHVNPFYGLCEILDRDTNVEVGESGEIVGTSFWMFGTPFIRYRTNDYAKKSEFGCDKCGRHFQLINNIEGRLQEYLISKTNRKISLCVWDCHFMHGQIFEHIDHFRFIQREVGKLVLAIVPNKLFTMEDEKKLLVNLKDFLGKDFECTIVQVNELQKTINGKFSLVEQHLNLFDTH